MPRNGSNSPRAGINTDFDAWFTKSFTTTAAQTGFQLTYGADDNSVVDPLTMRVRGLDGLRVVDASVMPYITNGNIYAPVMMVAEKSADLILGNTLLTPEPIEFYRYRATVAGSNATEGRAQ